MSGFIRECVRRKISCVVQFKYAEGALTALAVDGVRIPEDVKAVTHANKGLGPVWEKPLSRLEMDAAAHAAAASREVADCLKTGVLPPELDLGSVYKPGATF